MIKKVNAILLILPSSFLFGKVCTEGSPGYGVCGSLSGSDLLDCRSALWGELKPVDEGQIPGFPSSKDRDTTAYTGNQVADSNYPLWQDVEVRGGRLYSAYWGGFHIWDISGSRAVDPEKLVDIDGRAFCAVNNCVWPPGGEGDSYVQDLSAPVGSDLFVFTGLEVGTFVFSYDGGGNVSYKYQNDALDGRSVWVGDIGGVLYAFIGSDVGGVSGVHLVNLGIAGGLGGCYQNDLVVGGSCGGAYRGEVINLAGKYVDGIRFGGSVYLAVSTGMFTDPARGVWVYKVDDPENPQLVVRLHGNVDVVSNGIAFWEYGGDVYLGVYVVRNGSDEYLDIFRMTQCLDDGVCSGASLVSSTRAELASSSAFMFVSFSYAEGGVPFLYLGNETKCHSGLQQEFLFDVSDPYNPREISPKGTYTYVDGDPGSIDTVDYWGWYYSLNSTGFSQVMPRKARFNGRYLYRAALTILDIHEWVGNTPTINISGPTSGYAGDTLTFTANAVGCTPVTNGWSWNVDGGTIVGSSNGSSIDVYWNSIGVKNVTVTNSGCSNAQGAIQVTINDPAPSIGGISVYPNPALQCQSVTFDAQNVTGQPPITLSWEVKDSSNNTVATAGNVDPFVWNTSASTAAGNYTVTLTATNSAGSDNKSANVTVNALPTLSVDTPVIVNQVNNVVEFSVNSTGATEWCWDFGDGSTGCPSTGWVSDPSTGPNPTHTYSNLGTYTVSVYVRNCITGPIQSGTVDVTITSLEPLNAEFQATNIFCSSAACSASVGQTINFQDSSTGSPEFWDYDWDGDGIFEDSNNSSPVTSHVYNSEGNYTPKLRVRRGSASDEFTHVMIIVSTPNPPSISVTGPSNGVVNQTLDFTASASNCTPDNNGWNWNVDGGTIVGSSNGSNVSVKWSTPGTKNISVTNSGCGNAQGSKVVTISSGGGGGGGNGVVTISGPTTGTVGEELSFTANYQNCVPAIGGWQWDTDGGDIIGPSTNSSIKVKWNSAGSKTLSVFNEGCGSDSHNVNITPSGGDGNGSSIQVTGPTSGSIDQILSFTATAQGCTPDVSGWSWNVGDGTIVSQAASGNSSTIDAKWSFAGNKTVTVTNSECAGAVGEINVSIDANGGGGNGNEAEIVVPWLAVSNLAQGLPQQSDLYIYNPSNESMTVDIVFRKRGNPYQNPPTSTVTLMPGETKILYNVLESVFGLVNISGLIEVYPQNSSIEPVVTSFNRTMKGEDEFWQSVQSLSFSKFTSYLYNIETNPKLYLIGLNDNDSRISYFGITKPNDDGAICTIRAYSRDGSLLGTVTKSFGNQVQLQPKDVREQLNVTGETDYMVEIEIEEGAPLLAYGANVRKGTEDPSFLMPGRTNSSTQYLVGLIHRPGLNNANWIGDAVVANITGYPMDVYFEFIPIGVNQTSVTHGPVTLAPRQTLRIGGILSQYFNNEDAVGVLKVTSPGVNGVYPIVQGESFDDQGVLNRYGQFIPAMTDEDAATFGKKHILVGLRYGQGYRSVVWIYNSSEEPASCQLVYKAPDGSVIKSINYQVPAGKVRQIGALQHDLGDYEGVFTLEIQVGSGKILATAQVVRDSNNDPAFVVGKTR